MSQITVTPLKCKLFFKKRLFGISIFPVASFHFDHFINFRTFLVQTPVSSKIPPLQSKRSEQLICINPFPVKLNILLEINPLIGFSKHYSEKWKDWRNSRLGIKTNQLSTTISILSWQFVISIEEFDVITPIISW